MVHWNRAKAKKILIMQVAGLLFVLLAFVIVDVQNDEAIGDNSFLQLETALRLPIKELSGIHFEDGKDGLEIVAVGDRDSTLVSYNLKNGTVKTVDFSSVLKDNFSLCHSANNKVCSSYLKKLTSDWEALRIDGNGRRFILQEHSESVLILDKEHKLVGTIKFNFASANGSPTHKNQFKFQKNTLGEGLLLLKNGHILVAKESRPMALFELGPKGAQAKGVKGDLVLSPKQAFETSHVGGTPYETLAYWELGADGKCDFSDLEFLNGKILVLSQRCNQIFVFSELVKGHTRIDTVVKYNLPRNIKNAEALAILPDGRIVVGSDRRSKKKKNVFIFKDPFKIIGEAQKKDAL